MAIRESRSCTWEDTEAGWRVDVVDSALSVLPLVPRLHMTTAQARELAATLVKAAAFLEGVDAPKDAEKLVLPAPVVPGHGPEPDPFPSDVTVTVS